MIAEVKRAKRPKDLSSLLKKQVEFAKGMVVFAEGAVAAMEHESSRANRRDNAVMAILQQSVDIRGQMKRYWPLLSESDQETLREFGFRAPAEER